MQARTTKQHVHRMQCDTLGDVVSVEQADKVRAICCTAAALRSTPWLGWSCK